MPSNASVSAACVPSFTTSPLTRTSTGPALSSGPSALKWRVIVAWNDLAAGGRSIGKFGLIRLAPLPGVPLTVGSGGRRRGFGPPTLDRGRPECGGGRGLGGRG